MKECVNCGYSMNDDMVFCPKCGTKNESVKYCTRCGNQMAVDMDYCPKCGTKFDTYINNESYYKDEVYEYSLRTDNSHSVKKLEPDYAAISKRKWKPWAITCFVFAGMVLVAMSGVKENISMLSSFIALLAVSIVLGITFICLAKTPQNNRYLFTNASGITKKAFVIVSLILAFSIFLAISSMGHRTGKNLSRSSYKSEGGKQSGSNANKGNEVTLEKVQAWYTAQGGAVRESLLEYSTKVDGISDIRITSSKFLLGESYGFYDCHYTYGFSCKVNGESCTGEARAFLKYQDSDIKWFHFEIFRDSDSESIYEEYDESYDDIIEEYYKELQSKYN